MLEAQLSQTLEQIVGSENFSLTDADRVLHGRDQSSHPPHLPDAVIWPQNSQQVSQILRQANQHRIPIVGWGAGSSLEGNPIPVHGGMVVNFQQMNKILALHTADFQVTVQPGIFYKDMNKILGQHGLFFAPDPGANASIGGMIANNAAGTRTVKYGATCDNVLALEVVLANGEIIRTGSRSLKQSAGYDLTHLLIGSEGTLGLVTEATLKLAPLPERFSAVLASFDSTAAAAEAVYSIISFGLTPAALELLDAAAITYMNQDKAIDLPVIPTLLMEFHGPTAETLNNELQLVEKICMECGGRHFEAGVGRDERDRLWHGRHQLGEILFRAHPQSTYLITDVSVPISSYPKLAAYTSDLMQTMDIPGALFGHAGDGNLHTIVFAPKAEVAAHANLHRFNDQVVHKAINLEGTCTGEHGVGIGKQKYMVHEHGEAAINLMRQIKTTLDPHNILNPGKVLG
ncbi:MAG: FAD-binding oxidoreductase [Chloroflexi bacterium]|nr:FAD-binding oxidoreductase [Chloroflexota bacterium]